MSIPMSSYTRRCPAKFGSSGWVMKKNYHILFVHVSGHHVYKQLQLVNLYCAIIIIIICYFIWHTLQPQVIKGAEHIFTPARLYTLTPSQLLQRAYNPDWLTNNIRLGTCKMIMYKGWLEDVQRVCNAPFVQWSLRFKTTHSASKIWS